MSDAKSDYLESKILNHVLRNVTYTPPTTVYLALFTVTPSDAGGGTEASGNGYARQAITFGAPTGTTQVANTNDILFPAASPAGYGPLVAFGIFDAATVGNLLYWGPLSANVTLGVNDQFHAAVGAIVIAEA